MIWIDSAVFQKLGIVKQWCKVLSSSLYDTIEVYFILFLDLRDVNSWHSEEEKYGAAQL